MLKRLVGACHECPWVLDANDINYVHGVHSFHGRSVIQVVHGVFGSEEAAGKPAIRLAVEDGDLVMPISVAAVELPQCTGKLGGAMWPYLLGDLFSDRVLRHFEIVVGLKVGPKLRAHSKVPRQSKRGIGGNGPASMDDLPNARGRYTQMDCKPIRRQAKRLHEVLPERLAGVDRWHCFLASGHFSLNGNR